MDIETLPPYSWVHIGGDEAGNLQREKDARKKAVAKRQMRRYRAKHPDYVEKQVERRKEWAAKNKERVRKHSAAWFKAHPDKVSGYKLKERTKKLVNPNDVTPKPKLCESCGSSGTRHGKAGGGIHLDHCHTQNKFRGWLCAKCNFALGLLDDDPVKIEKLLRYAKDRGNGTVI